MINSPNDNNKTAKTFRLPGLFLLMAMFLSFAYTVPAFAASQWVSDPGTCNVTDPTNFPGQNCAPNMMCGDSAGIAQCYNTATLLPPAVSATSNTLYSASYPNGGYLTNCYATKDSAAPYCDNNQAFWCNRSNTCYTTQARDTICTANTWATATCGSCRTGYGDCDLDGGVCEIQFGVTNYPTGANNNYLNCTTAQCDTGYLDCDAGGIDVGNGCEIQNGATCTLGGLTGTWSGCTCVVAKQYFETGTKAQYATIDPLLWGVQFGVGPLITFGNSTDPALFVVENDGSVNLAAITAPGVTTNKLYNVAGSLYWNGVMIGAGGGGSGGGWVDDGTVVRLETITDNVGIGTNTPGAYKLYIQGRTMVDAGEDFNAFMVYNGPNDNNQIRVDGDMNNVLLSEDSGNVGIGTANPEQNLSIKGDVLIGQNEDVIIPESGIDRNLFLRARDGSLPGDQGTANLVFQRNLNNLARISVNTSNTLLLQPYNTGAWQAGLSVASTGNVGVRTNVPYYPLHVASPDSSITAYFEVLDNSRTGVYIGNGGMFSGDESGLYDIGGDVPLAVFDGANELMHYTQNIAVDVNSPRMSVGSSYAVEPSAVLSLDSINAGFLMPRMTTLQRDSIVSPSTALQIYNTQTQQFEYYNGVEWVAVGGSGGGSTITSIDLSVATYNGSFSSGGFVGYEAANNICRTDYPGSHFCRTDEIIEYIDKHSAAGFAGTAWIAEGPPGYTSNSNDCNGWTDSDSAKLGAFWSFSSTGGGMGWLTTCSVMKQLACCE